ncbi:MAG: S8 family serine peptidase [Bdellovibrionaceae bacterium]|nr:S8 family serine peptidase [Pseudobdellovibrionaceae bacterium]
MKIFMLLIATHLYVFCPLAFADIPPQQAQDKRNNMEFMSEGTSELFPVAIIDSGVEYTHSKISPYIHINKDSHQALSIESYVIQNDRIGWDFNENDSLPFDNNYSYEPKFVAQDFNQKNSSSTEKWLNFGKTLLTNLLEVVRMITNPGVPGHGTHVSGIVLSQCDKTCSIVPLKVFGGKDISIESLAAAIEYSRIKGYKLVNMSLGLDLKLKDSMPKAELEFVEKVKTLMLDSPDMLFVVAAGNDGSDLDKRESEVIPAMLKVHNIITVGAVDDNGVLATFSNYS